MNAALLRDTRCAIRDTFFKFLLLFILYTLYSILNIPSAFAQTSTGLLEPGQQIYNQPTSPHTASIALYNFGHALSCILMGQSPIAPCLEYKFVKDTQGMVKSVPILSSVNTSGGLLGMSGSALALVYDNKPLDQMSFFTYLGSNIGLVKEANAQVPGSGNQVLSPIFALWSVSRNFAYLVMIVIFILVGLMVMFRQKLNPQTVVSVQMALPGLVIGLVLITFSYFLAALITDMAYVSTDLVGYYFDEAIKISGGTPTTQPLTVRLANDSVVSIGAGSSYILDKSTIENFLNQIWEKLPPEPVPLVSNLAAYWDVQAIITPKGVVRFFSGALTYLLYNSLLGGIADLGGSIISSAGGILRFGRDLGAGVGTAKVLSVLGPIFGGTGTTIAAIHGGAAFIKPIPYLAYWASILAILILLYTVIKLFIRLINSYLTIIFLTIASPFVFLASSIPGRQGMVTDWLRNMLCNVLAFPAVIAVFYFAAFLLGSNGGNPVPGFGVDKELNITNTTGALPFLGGLSLDFLRKILAFVAILATPSIPDVICRTVGKPGQAGALLAGAVGGAIAGGQNYQGQISGQIQKAGSDVSGWRNSLFGQRQFSGGRLGEIQERLTPQGTEVGTTLPGIRGWIANPIEALRKNIQTTTPQSAKNTPAAGSNRTFKQT